MKIPSINNIIDWFFTVVGSYKCGQIYPDNIFISCQRHFHHFGKHCSRGGVKW